jgi:CheY-like chemotaxis protein
VLRGRILVVDGDEWTAKLLTRALEEQGWQVELFGEARAAFQRACGLVPDCIVSATELPDIDGFWLARRIRTEPGAISKVPILFVGAEDDKDARGQALSVGGDVFIRRPVTNDDLVASVGALVGMSRRLRGGMSDPPPSAGAMAAIRGDLSLFPLASILMMFEMERRSGTVDVVSGSGKRASMLLVEGLFSNTEISGQPKPALDVLREVLSWRAGRFSFTPRDAGHLPAPRASVGALVLEAMRLEDEKNSIGPPPSSRSPAKLVSTLPEAEIMEMPLIPDIPPPLPTPRVLVPSISKPASAPPSAPRPPSSPARPLAPRPGQPTLKQPPNVDAPPRKT